MNHLRNLAILLAAVFVIASCDDDTTVVPDPTLPIGEVISANTLTLDPSGYAPLSALLEMTLFAAANVDNMSVTVKGKSSSQGDLEKTYDVAGTDVEVPVLGLYADHTNTVKISFYNSDMAFIADTALSLTTAALPVGAPSVTTADVINSSQDINTMLLVSYAGGDHDFPSVVDVPFMPFIMDKFADIRWYVDYGTHPDLANLRFGHGFERLQNGNLYFGDQATHKIYEIDMLGYVVNTWDLPVNYEFHHEVWEKSNGNFIIAIDNTTLTTIEDWMIEIDRSGNVVREWDFNQSLQNDRYVMEDGIQPGPIERDWLHQNGQTWDDNDNSLVITAREQGLIKVTASNQVVWIAAPHRNWGMNGAGQDLNDYLLTPLDANNDPITDTSVLNGWTNHPDFEWPWYLHAPLVTPEGTFMVFDNGGSRNYVVPDAVDAYSRAVEYEIDADSMTIKQKFQYGKEQGFDLFSAIVSDVDYDATLNTVTFAGGTMLDHPNFQMASRFWGKSIEVDRSTGAVVSEYTVEPYKPLFIITFNRTEKMDLYVEE
ncbi:MAG: aryl-sulfate sulfotransferase [Bacteroidetes bacterium]|nr:aryl-sulfate sulfotransferase [Bacteroidota bacterium]